MQTDKHVILWLVRHGQTTANADRLLSGWVNPSLTTLGVDQACALRPRLEKESFDGVYASDLIRTIQTARLAYGEPQIEPAIREMSYGNYDGKSFDEVDPQFMKDLYAFKDFQAPNGETIDEATQRVTGFLNTLKPGRYLIFCHGGVIRTISRHIGEDRFIDNGTLLIVNWTTQEILGN